MEAGGKKPDQRRQLPSTAEAGQLGKAGEPKAVRKEAWQAKVRADPYAAGPRLC